MYYLVQENVFRKYHYDALVESLDRMGCNYHLVEELPYIDEIINLGQLPTNNVFPFGSVRMAKISAEKGWVPGSFMDDNHDFMVYRDYYKENLLNWDSKIVKFGDKFDLPDFFFAKPTKDSKMFNGEVFSKEAWIRWNDTMILNGADREATVQISSWKETQKEIRIWIVKGQIVTASQYKLGIKVLYDSFVDPSAIDFCKEMIKLYQVADSFVMDVCLYNNEWKIVECGCINCCGFYHSDISKLIDSLEIAYNKEVQINI